MAVKSFMKSSGLTALAVGIAAMVLPAAASAQQMSKSEWQQNRQARSEAPAQNNAGNWQGRGNGQERSNARSNGGNSQGRGNWQARQAQAQPQAQPQFRVQQQAAPQQVQRSWNGGDRSSWRQNNVQGQNNWQQRRLEQQQQQAQAQQNVQRRWDGQNRWSGQNRQVDRNRWDGQNRRYDGNRVWSGRDGNTSRWNNNWRRDNRYNWYSYRNTNRNVFRLGRYYSPYSNWSYRRLNIGFFLEPLFYGSNYWLDDPWQYRLPEAYGPYRWVRYYDDALLVDIYTGEVVDVIHDFFW